MPSDGLPKNLEPLAAGDPATIGPYVLVGRLGSGGMGTVYLGRAPEKGTHVAIKVIRPELAFDEATRARFRDEMENARKVASFCTAKVLDHGTFQNRPYMVTEDIAGTALAEHIAEHGPLDSGTLHGFALGVAAALAAIHKAGLVHRDLKPANVLLSLSGPRVIDFGIARALNTSTSHTQTGIVMGSPGWMAPEQLLEEKVTTKADIFAWGCLVAFAGNGRHPFGNGDAMTLGKRMLFAEPDIGNLDPPLDRLVARALAKDPDQRPTAQELLLELAGGTDSNDTNDVVSHALHQSWRPNFPPMPPGYPPPSPQAHSGMPGPQAQAQAPGQTTIAPQPYAHPPQGGPGPMPPQAAGPQGGPQGGPQSPPMPQRPGPQAPHHTGQIPVVPPTTGRQPPRSPAAQGSSGGPQARPYVPPNPLPPHRPLRPDSSRSRLLIVFAVLGAVLLAVVLVFGLVFFQDWFSSTSDTNPPGQGQEQQSSAPKEDPDDESDKSDTQAADPQAGESLRFDLLDWYCGNQVLDRPLIVNGGEYCVAEIEAHNSANYPVKFRHDLQILAHASGEQTKADAPLHGEGADPLWAGPIQPGDTVRGYLVFIVHSELTPEVLILRSTVDSPGQQIEIPSGQPA